jgi:transposase
MGWYREVGVKSLDSHTVRSMLGVRAQLVGMRTEVINQIRGILKNFGIVLGKEQGMRFERRVEEVTQGEGMLNDTLRALLAVLRHLSEQISRLDGSARTFAKIRFAVTS